MKVFIFVLILLSSLNLFAEDKQLRIIKSNGEEEIYQLSDIKQINFEQFTYAGRCKFNLINGDSVQFAVDEVISMTVKKGLEQNDSIVVNYKHNEIKIYSIAIDDIKEIVFWNRKHIEVFIIGIKAEYTDGVREFKYHSKYFNTDRHSSWEDFINCIPEYPPLAPINRGGHLNYSDYNYSSSGLDHNCYFYYTTIFLNEAEQLIDSLILTRVWKDYTIPQGGGSWRDESDYEDRVILYSIPFEFEGDCIIAEFKIDDLNKIRYYYNYNNVTGSGGGHTTTHTFFMKFLEISENALITIKIY